MTIMPPFLVSLAAALGIGLLVGLERERKNGHLPAQSPAGLRTFAIASLLGWVSSSLALPWLLPVLLLALSVLLALAYWRSERADRGLTTEVALLLVLLLGAMAFTQAALAVGIAVVVAALLFYREELHHFVRSQLSDAEVRDGIVLATAALVILPLVPAGFIGPFGAINLRTVWMLCVLMMGIGAIGHLAIRLAGPRFGLPLAGFISGFASSTATIASMGDYARREPAMRRAAVSAAVMSSVATMVLMAMVLGAIDLAVLRLLAPALALAGVLTLSYAAWGFFHQPVHGENSRLLNGRVFDWRMALAAALVFAGVQLFSALLFHWLGNQGVLLSTALSGFGDAHAAAASAAVLAQSGKAAAADVVLPVLAALSTNAFSKSVMAWVSGGRGFALRVLPGLWLPLLSMWLYWWFS